MATLDRLERIIHTAVQEGDLEVIKGFTKIFPVSYYKRWFPVFTLICTALERKHIEIAKLLIKTCSGIIDPTQGGPISDCSNVIMLAVLHGDLEIIKIVVESLTLLGDSYYKTNERNLPVFSNEIYHPLFSIAKRTPVDEECCQIFNYILEQALRINDKCKFDGYTLLHIAAEEGNVDIIPLIFQRKPYLNVMSTKKQTPLHIAAAQGHFQIVSLLLEHGAKCIRKDINQETPLRLALKNGDKSTIEILLHHVLCQDSLEKNQTLPLEDISLVVYCAVFTGMKTVVGMLLSRVDINNGFPETRKTYLHVAVENGFEDIVRLLLKRDAKLNNDIIDHGYTPLHIAAEKGNERIVKLLLEYAVNGFEPSSMFSLAGKNGYSPLHIAAEKGNERTVQLLLEHAVNFCGVSSMFNLAGENGYNPLHIAAQNGHEKVVKVLLERKDISVDSTTTNGLMPIHIAAQKGHIEVVLLLLECGTQVDAIGGTVREIELYKPQCFEGNVEYNEWDSSCSEYLVTLEEFYTPLYIASYYGYENVVETLLNKGADPNYSLAPSKKCLTPIYAAAQGGHKNIAELLLKHGAKVDSVLGSDDDEYKIVSTPLLVASRKKHEGIVKLLLENGADAKAKYNVPFDFCSTAIENLFSRNEFRGSNLYQSEDVKLGYTPLHYAAELGSEEMVNILLNYGADINDSSDIEEKVRPLSLAIKSGHEEIVQILLDAGVDLSYQIHSSNESLLTYALKFRNEKIVEMLFKKGLNADAVNGKDSLYNALKYDSSCSERSTPIFDIVISRDVHSIKLFYKENVSFKIKSTDGTPLLHYAVQSYYDEEVIKLLLYCGTEINAKNEDDLTPLHYLIESKDYTYNVYRIYEQDKLLFCKMKLLLEYGSDPNAWSEIRGEAVLHTAVRKQSNWVVDLLIQYGADINKTDKEGVTAYQLAVEYLQCYAKRCSACNNLIPGGFFKNCDEAVVLCEAIVQTMTKEIARQVSMKTDINEHSAKLIETDLIKPYYECCRKEIEQTFSSIGNTVCLLFYILVFNDRKIDAFARHRAITEAIEEKSLSIRFPKYARIMRARIGKAEKRRILLGKNGQQFKKALIWDVPLCVVFKIFTYLSEPDLRILNMACGPFRPDKEEYNVSDKDLEDFDLVYGEMVFDKVL